MCELTPAPDNAPMGSDLDHEYRIALRSTRPEDLKPLLEAGIRQKTISIVRPAIARIAVTGGTYQPEPEGRYAYLLPVRLESADTAEAANPVEVLHRGSIVDLVAFHPKFPLRWALRRDAAEWLGAIEPQYLDPAPVPIWRSPLEWLRAGCRGLALLSLEPTIAYRILSMCSSGLLAEDEVHAVELRRLAAPPWPAPLVRVRRDGRNVA